MRIVKHSRAVTKISKQAIEDPELADRFNRVLEETVEAVEEAAVRYAFIGGIASGGLGRPRSTHDIDLFVMPDDAELALRSLAKRGFRIEKTDPSWLYKGFKEGILVDIIFRSKGEIYLDSEMYQKTITAEFHGKRLRLVAPEDLMIIKAAAHGELTPSHWHDAIALLSHANLDWEYLIRRARKAPRRVLSLLLYAQSNDVWVPNHAVHRLYETVFCDNQMLHGFGGGVGDRTARSLRGTSHEEDRVVIKTPSPTSGRPGHVYAVAHLRQCLAEDERTNELDVQIDQVGERILLRGEVPTQERRQIVEKIAQERLPDCLIENQIRILDLKEPQGVEEMK